MSLGGNVWPPPNGGCWVGVGVGDGVGVVGGETVGLLVGKLGSPPGPQPGHLAAPSVVVLQPAAAATSNAAATPALMPWDIRTGELLPVECQGTQSVAEVT
ncbi:hypothetical protein MSAR_20750 [Mycolicibacterium sarraceniae]|uniref:Uncharacterized protein n=1 Tax=Mycolicibacterium sarraceniae TaxID=1534348 RepID=A0A7I7SS14_9MYCO|nr:hypothetical protein MSAR_20750 [Mycolicibacterium sarraceniae]